MAGFVIGPVKGESSIIPLYDINSALSGPRIDPDIRPEVRHIRQVHQHEINKALAQEALGAKIVKDASCKICDKPHTFNGNLNRFILHITCAEHVRNYTRSGGIITQKCIDYWLDNLRPYSLNDGISTVEEMVKQHDILKARQQEYIRRFPIPHCFPLAEVNHNDTSAQAPDSSLFDIDRWLYDVPDKAVLEAFNSFIKWPMCPQCPQKQASTFNNYVRHVLSDKHMNNYKKAGGRLTEDVVKWYREIFSAVSQDPSKVKTTGAASEEKRQWVPNDDEWAAKQPKTSDPASQTMRTAVSEMEHLLTENRVKVSYQEKRRQEALHVLAETAGKEKKKKSGQQGGGPMRGGQNNRGRPSGPTHHPFHPYYSTVPETPKEPVNNPPALRPFLSMPPSLPYGQVPPPMANHGYPGYMEPPFQGRQQEHPRGPPAPPPPRPPPMEYNSEPCGDCGMDERFHQHPQGHPHPPHRHQCDEGHYGYDDYEEERYQGPPQRGPPQYPPRGRGGRYQGPPAREEYPPYPNGGPRRGPPGNEEEEYWPPQGAPSFPRRGPPRGNPAGRGYPSGRGQGPPPYRGRPPMLPPPAHYQDDYNDNSNYYQGQYHEQY